MAFDGLGLTGAPVVVGIDGSDSAVEAALWAAEECSRAGVDLELAHCAAPAASSNTASATVAVLATAADAVAHHVPGTTVVRRELTGSPINELARLSRAASLLVIGHRGTDAGLPGAGSTAVGLTLSAHCPVVIFRPNDSLRSSPPVVVGLDGSAVSAAAAQFAFVQASRRQAALVAVMAWSEILLDDVSHSLTTVTDWDSAAEDYRRLLAQQLAGFQEQFPDVSIERVLTRDRPVRALLRESAGAQLLVVGTRGRGGFPSMLLGSTSRALIDYAPCPLAVVSAPGADTL